MRKLLFLSALLGIAICGCNSDALERHELMKFGMMYHDFHSQHERGPSDLDELKSFTPSQFTGIETKDGNPLSKIFSKIENGEIVVVWNGKLASDGNQNGQYVLAYDKDVPTKGGLVLDGGAAVEEMTAETFAKKEKLPQ